MKVVGIQNIRLSSTITPAFWGSINLPKWWKIEIGEHTKYGFNYKEGDVNPITIGDYSFFAEDIKIMDNNNYTPNPLNCEIVYHSDHKSYYRRRKYSDSKPIVIGNNVWYGSNVRINKGVTIGDGAVITACTVVTKDVPARSIYDYNPEKIVKPDIDKLP